MKGLHEYPDDGIVVVMKTDEYLSFPEDLRRRELVWGVVREPPSPFAPHQRVTTELTALLHQHARAHDLGTVLVAPMDVVLDEGKGLVLQPDVMFIARGRESIIRDFVRGAPDLVVEVASPGTAGYDRTEKIGLYRTYGVRECWLVDPQQHAVTVVDLSPGGARVQYQGNAVLRSSVLPRFSRAAVELVGGDQIP